LEYLDDECCGSGEIFEWKMELGFPFKDAKQQEIKQLQYLSVMTREDNNFHAIFGDSCLEDLV
jgi:hypothetical protein